MGAAAFTTATGKSEAFVPENLVVTSTRGGILALVFDTPLEAETGPEPLQTLRAVHEEGCVHFASTHTSVSSSFTYCFKTFSVRRSSSLTAETSRKHSA